MLDEETTIGDGCYCPKCGWETNSRDCMEFGCDEGYRDDYEEDPMWFDPGDTSPCSTCHGMGIERWCPKCGWRWSGEKLRTDDE